MSITIADEAARWRKLMRLVGNPKDASDVTVKFFYDDATHTSHIMVGTCNYFGEYGKGDFGSVIDLIDESEY